MTQRHPSAPTCAPTPTPTPGDLRRLLDTVLDALTLPYDLADYDARILRRAALARTLARTALTEHSGNLGWDVDYLRTQLAQEESEAAERTKNTCRRCSTQFDPNDTAFDGRARHAESPYCRRCVDNCHGGGAEHVCPICDPARYGGVQ